MNSIRDKLSPTEQFKYDLSLKMYGDVFVWEGKVLNSFAIDYLSKTGNLINSLIEKGDKECQ